MTSGRMAGQMYWFEPDDECAGAARYRCDSFPTAVQNDYALGLYELLRPPT